MVLKETIRDHCCDMILSDEQLKKIMCGIMCGLKKGLGKATHASATIKCFLTFVQDLPNGKEKGKFLALDLGGTNFRVLLVTLAPDQFDMKSKIYAVPEAIMTGTGTELFDHIANCLGDFVKEQNIMTEELPLGFTFSFPCEQTGLTKGTLRMWTKGFTASGVAGEDVVKLLEEAIKRKKDIKIEVCALLNDTTGTLMSCAWKNHDCRIGVIVGTGCNACYVEQIENCETFEGDKTKKEMIINCEWGAYGDHGELEFIMTEYDRDIDERSVNPTQQILEKMVSGMYMGEIVRLMLVKFTKEKLLFCGKGSDALFKPDAFQTKFLSDIESDPPGCYQKCKSVLNELCLQHATDQDCVNVRFVCECVSRRAAYIVSAGLAALINKTAYPKITIGVDGSVYRFHPHFSNLMNEKIGQLCRPSCKYDLMLSEDGSGRGAALVAAVASRDTEKKDKEKEKNAMKC